MSGGFARSVARALLRLYSADFRARYGAEALEVVEGDLGAARERAGLLGWWRMGLVLAAFGMHGVLDRITGGPSGGGLTGWAGPGWSHDVRGAVRSAVRRPAFTLVAAASLAVGVGASTAAFALIDALLLRDISGAADRDRIVEVQRIERGGEPAQWTWPDFVRLRDGSAPLASAALVQPGAVSLSEGAGGAGAGADRVMALFVTSEYFATLGVRPARGRFPGAEADRPDGGVREVVLSHGSWQERFQGDPEVVGRVIRVNREAYTVVGVAPADFHGHRFGSRPSLYLPLTRHPAALADPERVFRSATVGWGEVLARLAEGATAERLEGALAAVAWEGGDPGGAPPGAEPPPRIRAVPARPLPLEARAPVTAAGTLLVGLLLLVLGATSANVAGMLLARAASRTGEMALRLALGSGRGRLVRHLVAEALLIFLVGGVAGLAVARRLVPWFDPGRWVPTPFPIDLGVEVDGRSFAFALAVTTLFGLACGLLPALQVVRGDLATMMRRSSGGGVRTGRLRSAFITGQVTVAALLLVSAALFVRSLHEGASIEPGFTPAGVHTTRLDLALEGRDDPDEIRTFTAEVVAHLRGRPGVERVAVATDVPLDGGSSSAPVRVGSAGAERWIQSHFAHVTDGYFEALSIPLRAGRTFEASDGADAPRVAILNETLARTAFPDGDALGRVVYFALDSVGREVVGVVGDTSADLVTDEAAPQIFTPLQQDPAPTLHVLARIAGDEGAAGRLLGDEILAVDPALALGPVRVLADLTDLGLLPQRIVVAIAGALGALALLLAALGVYGVVSFTVRRRTREIGVRMALGSSRTTVVGGVLREGVLLALPGLLIGGVLALLLAGLLRSFMVGVGPSDPLSWLAALGLLLAVIVLACVLPARRAAGVAPADALRVE